MRRPLFSSSDLKKIVTLVGKATHVTQHFRENLSAEPSKGPEKGGDPPVDAARVHLGDLFLPHGCEVILAYMPQPFSLLQEIVVHLLQLLGSELCHGGFRRPLESRGGGVFGAKSFQLPRPLSPKPCLVICDL